MESLRPFWRIILFSLIFTLASCNGVGKADIDGLTSTAGNHAEDSGDEADDGDDDGNDDDIVVPLTSSFTGINSIDQTTDTTLRLSWTPHADAVAYHIYDESSGTPVFLTTVLGQASSSTTLTSLNPSTNYKFRVRAMGTDGLNDSNTANIPVTTNLAPDIPSLLTLLSPTSGVSSSSTITVRVSGVKNGDTVKLWSDNCTTEIASGVATGSTIDLTSSALTPGVYAIHANAINSSLGDSGCTAVGMAYERLDCPANYLAVESNIALGSSDFCVMKYEARNVAGDPASVSSGVPWVNVDRATAKAACMGLPGGQYDLISNLEWMALARNIEATASNWSGEVVGVGALYRGHSDEAPGTAGIGITDDTDPYDGTGNNASEVMGSGKEQRRTLSLSNGEVIWDLAGNLNEWIDWTLGGALAEDGPTTCAGANTEIPLMACGVDLVANAYMPANPAGILAANYNSSYGLGTLFGGGNGGVVRGGAAYDGLTSGIFSLYLDLHPAYTWTDVGFRCVYRP